MPIDRSQQLKAAYDAFCNTASPQERASLDRILQTAHHQASDVLAGQGAHVQFPAFASVWSQLNPGVQSLREQLAPGMAAEALLPAHVDGAGLIWGVGKYEQLDAAWTEALVRFLRYKSDRAPFATSPQTIAIPNTTTLALAGDWGTGFYAGIGAEAVQQQIVKAKPAYTVHLGDVYYAGSPEEEQTRFVDLWPRGTAASFALNSNHEMYSGAHGYFEVALASAGPFAAQHGTSYFALTNEHWILVGLDTAYFSSPDNLYMDGTLDRSQQQFLQAMSAQYPGRRVVIVSHHEGIDLTGQNTNGLWAQVKSALGRVPNYWYFGHAHNAVVYTPIQNCRCRCIGHGAIPYGVATELEGAVEWYEKGNAHDADTPERVLNGYLQLTLDGSTLSEKLIGEDGSTRWGA